MHLPIFQTTSEIVEYCWANRKWMAIYAAVPALLSSVANIMAWLAGADLEDPRSPAFLALTLFNAIVFLPFIVTWYRLIILGKEDLATRPLFTLSGLEGRMLAWQLITGLIVLASAAVGALLISAVINVFSPALGGGAEALAALGLGVWGVLMIAFMCRLSLALAMAATGRPVILSEAWSKSTGLGIRMAGIFAMCILCVAACVIPLQLFVLVASTVAGLIVEAAAESAGILFEILLSAVASVFIYALPATLFAFVYARIAEAMARPGSKDSMSSPPDSETHISDMPTDSSNEEEVAKVLQKLGALMESKPKETAEDIRTLLDSLGYAIPMPADTNVEDVEINGVLGHWIEADGAEHEKIMLMLHGGGFVAGGITSHRRLAADISAVCGFRVLLIDYRLAPEHPYPAGLDDCVAAYQGLLDAGYKPGHIAIIGDSAGGGLTLSLALRLKDKEIDQPAALIALSPWANLACDGETMETKAADDPTTSRDTLVALAAQYLNDHDPKDPLASPVYGDLRGLPPLLIQVGSREVLLDDSRKLATRARADEIAVTLEEWQGMFHVWHMWADDLTDARRALGGIGLFVRRFMG